MFSLALYDKVESQTKYIHWQSGGKRLKRYS